MPGAVLTLRIPTIADAPVRSRNDICLVCAQDLLGGSLEPVKEGDRPFDHLDEGRSGRIECIDPTREPATLAGHEGGIVECIAQQSCALIGRDQRHREIVGIPAPHEAKLILDPREGDSDEVGSTVTAAGPALVELRTERALRTSVLGDQVALPGQDLHESFESAFGSPMIGFDCSQRAPDGVQMCLHDSVDDLVLGLEVVVDVPQRYVCR